jgi:succinylglutamate desuccinylase
MNLVELDHLPAGLLERPASALYQQLDGPTLIHLEGRVKRPLFVSVLQHGNEITGWEAVRRLLKKHDFGTSLPRSLLLFVGNIQAAKHRLRRLDDQPDYNRCWPGGNAMDPQYQELFHRLHQRIIDANPIAGIDIHNNTGLNPHYAAVNRIRSDHLRLASLFSQKVVYFTMPPGTLSHSLSPHLPSLTLECGMAGEIHGTDHTEAFLETCLHLDDIATSRVDADQVHLYHMVATVKVSNQILFGFGRVPTDLALPENLDHFNFTELPPGTSFGTINNRVAQPLIATNSTGLDVTSHYFSFDDGKITTTREIMPSMITLDRRVIQQDCLCYLMERIHFEDLAEVSDRELLPDAMRRSDRPGEPSRTL